ncbi:MAG: ParB/RepB/Spo0J family partition protein [Proteobacteria bacterium]|nr:ParB/RepB/Spo0J family partition protein [Pseudomonadota bacterium]
MKKKVLGRGLSALIGSPSGAVKATGNTTGGVASEGGGVGLSPGEIPGAGKYLLCAIGDLSPNTVQPRKRFNDSALSQLSASIREKGVIEPLIARRTERGMELIAGERRLRASKLAGLTHVPVVIVEANDEQSLEFAIIENIQREDLDAIEEAEAYKSLSDFGHSQEEIARRVGKERATVANYMRLLKLPPEVKDELAKGTISMGHARAILSVEGHAPQTALCRKVIVKRLSVRETEALAASCTVESGKRKKLPKRETPLEEELRDIFQTKVHVKDSNGRGKIELVYFTADERERIIELLRSVEG